MSEPLNVTSMSPRSPSRSGGALGCVAMLAKGAVEVVEVAVANSGAATEYAAESLKGDIEVVRVAVTH